MQSLISFENISKDFQNHRILDNISLDVLPREKLALVGLSGSGKSTIARLMLGLESPTQGVIKKTEGLDIQMVFQDPASSMNPRMTVSQVIQEPMTLQGKTGDIASVLAQVQLPLHMAHQPLRVLSGGEKQRVAIARALCVQPDLLLLDEALSALDPHIQWELFVLLEQLHREQNLTMLMISHDLSFVQKFCDRVLVLHDHKIIENASPQTLGSHAFTQRLLQTSRGFVLQ